MVIVKLLGGLGNQLFQIAYAIRLSEIYNCDIFLDTSVYNTYKIRRFSSDNLVLQDNINILGENDIPSIYKIYFKITQSLYRIWQKCMKSIGFDYKFGETGFRLLSKIGLLYNFDNYFYNTKPNLGKYHVIYGYFQSEKYFIDVKSQVIKAFNVKHEMDYAELDYFNLIRNSECSIAVSMRLGDDYTSSPILNVCDREYFLKSIYSLRNLFPYAKLFIFSDDIPLAISMLSELDDLVFIENRSDYQSLRLMSLCQHFIISNSSFSWWGAYLSDNINKIIIAPDVWYNTICGHVDIYNDSMIRFSDLHRLKV